MASMRNYTTLNLKPMMNNSNKEAILKDYQIKKFCLYGFLKNLKFFEPYLIVYLMSNNINLFQIGILIAIRECVVNIFEIPSGFIADYFGRKKDMYFCFVFYIVSFVLFFFADSFAMVAFGMVLFGLGEAFRSGTHKAMIYTYTDSKGWQNERAFIYGRTRSFSLIGSAISSLCGIIIILSISADRYIFLFSVIPYVLDFILIATYPKFLDMADKKSNLSFKAMVVGVINSFRINKKMRCILIEEGMAEATFSFVKDLIQPILELIIIGSGVAIISGLSADDGLKVVLGLVYAILNLVGAYFSKKAYLIRGGRTSMECLRFIHIGLGILCGLLAIFSGQYILVCVIYILIYILHSIRKPLFVDEIDKHIDKSNRATIISASAQLKSIFLMVFAPLLGLIAETFGIGWVMLLLAAIFTATIPLLLLSRGAGTPLKG